MKPDESASRSGRSKRKKREFLKFSFGTSASCPNCRYRFNVPAAPVSERLPIQLVDDVRTEGLIAYINALFVSGNAVPVTSTLFGIESWEVIKECLRDGLPLDYNVVESECVYRRKLAVYGEETRATSPLAKLRASLSER